MVTIPPEVVLILASSTVLVKASSLVNLDFAGMVVCRRVCSAVYMAKVGGSWICVLVLGS